MRTADTESADPNVRSERLAVVIPTYNEPELLQQCLSSLDWPDELEVTLVIVNAGEPLGFELPAKAVEVKVTSDCFWTASVEAGFAWIRSQKPEFDWAMLANADNTFYPGSVGRLLALCRKEPGVVAACPAYIRTDEEPEKLLYSDQLDLGILLYGKLNRRWSKPEEAPDEPFEIQLTGGQGVLFPAKLLAQFAMDAKRFPHHAGDHDFWLQMRRKGVRLMVEPKAGIVNLRILGGKHATGFWAKVKKLWWRLGSDLTQDSPKVMWRLRAKHLPLPAAIASFVLSFGARWTIGFPKLLKRT